MASNVHVANIRKLQTEIKDLQTTYDGLKFAMENIEIGVNMTPEGYNIMNLILIWAHKQLEEHKIELEKLLDIV